MPDRVQLPISDQLIRATARIECANAADKLSCGTSFFFRVELDGATHAPLLVTNRHVVADQRRATVYLTARQAGSGAQRQVIPLCINDLQELVIYHPNEAIDLAAIAFAPLLYVLNQGNLTPEFITLRSADIVSDSTLEDCRALEDLVMIGYPNGVWDAHNNRPIVRRASTATPLFEDYNNDPKFLIDCACFPGSSGSPVFLLNEGVYASKKGSFIGSTRVALVGILHAGFLHLTRGRVREATISSMQNLETEVVVPNSIGICIKARELLGLGTAVKAKTPLLAAA